MEKNVQIVFVLGVSLFVAIATFSAQDDPTPSPSKTPTPQPTYESESNDDMSDLESAIAVPAFAIEEPFIQADLSILSGNVQRPNGLYWHNGMVYAACNGDWTIYEINADNGSTITYLWGIRNAHDLYVETDENGELNLWIPDFQSNALVRIYQRSLETVAADLVGPWGISPLDDAFLVTDLLDNALLHIDRSGNVQRLVEGFRSPAGLVVDENVVYVANNGSARRAIEWAMVDDINTDSTLASEDVMQPLVSGLQNTTGVVLGNDDYLYFAYSLGTRGVIGRIDPAFCMDNGGCTNDQVEIVVYTDLAAPLAGLALSPDMRLYTHTIFSPDIYYVDLLPQETS